MFKTDYLIDGLDTMTLEVTVSGTMHFLKNISTGRYTIEGITLSPGGQATLFFRPREDIRTIYKTRRCCITVSADEAFSLVVKEQCSAHERTTTKYIFLNCRTNDAGEPYFHCDILQKSVKGAIVTGGVRTGTTPEHLLVEGFKKIQSIDDKTRSSNSVILDYRREAS